MLRHIPLACALLLLLPQAAGSGPAPFAPHLVTTAPLDTAGVSVEWAPGPEVADAYRVYGVDGGLLTVLLDTAGTSAPVSFAAVVPAGFDTYAVSGVRGDVESAPVFAWDGPGEGCIYIQRQPPDVWIGSC